MTNSPLQSIFQENWVTQLFSFILWITRESFDKLGKELHWANLFQNTEDTLVFTSIKSSDDPPGKGRTDAFDMKGKIAYSTRFWTRETGSIYNLDDLYGNLATLSVKFQVVDNIKINKSVQFHVISKENFLVLRPLENSLE